ncbi:MAG TPA: hypothetical protein VIH21_09785 [Dehalococcoidia bacterium]|jgi:hypothetical protein
MNIDPLVGTPVRVPPGRVAVRLNEGHRRAYRTLYGRYQTILDGLPVLRDDRDFDGRAVKVTPSQLEALNHAFATLADGNGAAGRKPGSVFAGQEASKEQLFKRIQYLS